MVAILVLDLALVGLLLTSNVGRAAQGDRAAQWFAASLATGMLTLCAPWLAPQNTGELVNLGFVLSNAAGLLVGPCLILHARALAARYANDPVQPGFPPTYFWLPFGLALLVYAAAGLARIPPGAFELWIAMSKAISLVVSVVIAITTIVGCRKTTPAGLGRHADLWFTITVVLLGLLTLPAALIGGEVMAQMIYDGAVLPALGISLWLLTCWRLRGHRPSPGTTEPHPSAVSPAASCEVQQPAPEDAVLAAVYKAFVTSLETDRGWLDADFGLDDAARQMGMRRHLLSEAINQHVSGGFSTVLNDYRLVAFRAALATAPETETVLEIGLRCGFGSKASLHRLVKRDCGLSPGELRRVIRHSHRTP